MEADGQSPDPVDDFVVGDRVLVKGSRRGKIAFLGETRFAPGEWAGIVLDEPVGKNDGTVSGVRYFTCEPMLGIFCRIDQLSHCSDPVVSPLRTSTRPPVSPARGSLSTNYGATNSPGRFNSGSFDFNVPSGAAFSDNHPSTADYDDVHSEQSAGSGPAAHLNLQLDFEVGDRVLVSNATVGRARYIGETRFASGVWIGVELEEPSGKNDGSVSGVRYFACRPFYGLFAPMQKVRRYAESSSPVEAHADVAVEFSAPELESQLNGPSANVSLPVRRSVAGANLVESGSRESLASGGASSICSSASRPGASRMNKNPVPNNKTSNSAGKQNRLFPQDASSLAPSGPRPSGTYAPATVSKQLYGVQNPNSATATSKTASGKSGDVNPSGTALQKVLREHGDHIQALQRELHGGQNELAKQTARADALEQQVTSLNEQLAQAMQEKATLNERLDEEQKRIEQLEFELAEHESGAMVESCEGNAPADARVKQLEQQLAEARATAEEAQTRNDELRRSLDEARRGWTDARDSCAAYLDEIDRLRSDLTSRPSQPSPPLAPERLPDPSCAELTERIAELELRLRTSERERCEYVEKKRALQGENGELRSRIASLDEQLSSVSVRLAESVERHSMETQRRMEADRLRAALQAQLDDVRLRYDALLQRTTRLSNEKSEPERFTPTSNGLEHGPA